MKEQNNRELISERLKELETKYIADCKKVDDEMRSELKPVERFWKVCRTVALAGVLTAVSGIGGCMYGLINMPNEPLVKQANELSQDINYLRSTGPAHRQEWTTNSVFYSTPALREKIEQTEIKRVEYESAFSNLVASYKNEHKMITSQPKYVSSEAKSGRIESTGLKLFGLGALVAGGAFLLGAVRSEKLANRIADKYRHRKECLEVKYESERGRVRVGW